MSFLSGIKNFIKTEILGVQETDTKNQVAAKKDTTPVIECETEAPVDKLEKKNTKNSVQSVKTQKGMSRKAMEATIENTPSEHIDIKKMLRKGLIERVTGMTKDDFDKLTPQQKNRVVMAIKTSVEKFDELQEQGKISKKADLEEIVTSFAQILAEALNNGEVKNAKEFEKAMGDVFDNFGKDFEKKSRKEQRRIIKEHRLAEDKKMRAEIAKIDKNLSKEERAAEEAKIRNKYGHIRKGRFVDITAQCDSKTAVNSLVILDSKDLQYGAKTVLATRCNAEERTATADYAEYSVTKNIIADYKEIGDDVNGDVLEGYTQTFMEQKSANAVKAYQTDYVKDRDNYETALAKQKRGEALTADEQALLDTMKPDYYTATAKGIGSGALNNVNMTNDEKAEFISDWQADAKKYSDYKEVTQGVNKQLETNPELKEIKEKVVEYNQKRENNVVKENANKPVETKTPEHKTVAFQNSFAESRKYVSGIEKTHNVLKTETKTVTKMKSEKNTEKQEKYSKLNNNTMVIAANIKEEGMHKAIKKYGADAIKVIIDNPSFKHLRSNLTTIIRSYDLKSLIDLTATCSDSSFVFICEVVNKDFVTKLKENREHTKGLCFAAEKQVQDIEGKYETV